ncbi:MAG TPA: glucosaminidase domain-containing protein [Chitinophagaceae bacterium]|nr:glucosaminidase domain-containing protein [Chitinophagaceae bacterium]
MKWNRFFGIFVVFVFSFTIYGEAKNPQVEAYIEEYKWWAMMEQQRTGVPAAIKVAQAIHETGAGTSELALNANNHFGIKCRGNQWSGGQYTYTDDRPNECFRSYESPLESFKDHSDFLRNNKRYHQLFTLDCKDYKGWCHGLKAAGYATNPSYANLLIKYIEEYDLNQYTLQAMDSAYVVQGLIAHNKKKDYAVSERVSGQGYMAKEEEQKKTLENDIVYYKVTHKNGLKGFYGKKGDLLLESAIKQRIRYNRLLQLNDLEDAPLDRDMFIYLEPKHRIGQKEDFHIVKEGEKMIHISQEYGIQLRVLNQLNRIEMDGVLIAGQRINLKEQNDKEIEIKSEEVQEDKTSKLTRTPAISDGRYEYVNTQKRNNTSEKIEREKVAPNTSTQKTTSTTTSKLEKEESKLTDYGYPEYVETKKSDKKGTKKEEKVKTVVKDEDLSPLDRLKAHMDQNVYPERQIEHESGVPTSVNTNVSYETRPAGVSTPSEKASTASNKVESGQQYYTVKKGDTAYGVSKKHGITLKQLSDWNQLKGNMHIQVGQRLKVSP